MLHTVTLQELRKHGSKSLPSDRTVFLIVNSKPMSAIVPIEEYALLEQMREDMEDRADIEARKNEKAVPFTSLAALSKKA